MRFPLCCLAALLSACGTETVTVRGTLAEGTDATEVWVAGATERARVEADSFVLQGLTGDSLDLRFASDGADPARMRIAGLAPGAQLRLDGVWVEEGVAFPARIGLAEGAVVSINGLRMSAPEAVPAAVDAAGTVLARGEDALLVRPAGSTLADLRVVVTPGTVVRSPDGDPVELDELQFGDSVRVVGTGEGGYVIAAELVLPRPESGDDGGRGRGRRRE